MEKRRGGKRRKRMDTRKRLILFIDGALILALLAAGAWLAVRLKDGGKQSVQGDAPSASAPAQEETTQGEPAQGEAQSPEPGAAAEKGTAADRAAALTALQKEGVPAVAWLSSPGTAIDYPVVQNADDEYYMTRNVYDKKDQNGAICLDGRNSAELLDGQIILYGNPMADGSMFGSLVSYGQQDYFAAHPALSLFTPEQMYTVQVFAAHLTSPDRSNYPTWFETADARAAYIQQVCAKSMIQTDLEIPADARLISLVTNSDYEAGDNSRFVVHGYLAAN